MRFFGKVGYGESAETLLGSGVWVPVITEVDYFGDVVRDTRRIDAADQVNENLRLSNLISIVADEYANHHFHNMKYVEWNGVRWIVNAIEVKPPRLLLTLGGEYNGPTP